MSRVLIMEDDSDLATAWQLALEAVNLEVTVVALPDDAISLLSQQRYDLIVTDILIREPSGVLSDRGGLSLLSHVRLKVAEKPLLLVVSGASESVHVEELAGLLKADAALRKPLQPDALLDEVLRLLATRSAPNDRAP